jgi:GMP synthase (glutamine-hydrolysing)
VINNFFNNKGQLWMRSLKDSLVACRASVQEKAWDALSSCRFQDYDGVVLSGSQAMVSDAKTFGRFAQEASMVRDSRVPVLGICFGHQLISKVFGAEVVRAASPTAKYVDTDVLVEDPLFEGLRGMISVYESHYEVVKSAPEGFSLLARSRSSAVGAIRHRRLPIHGVQFHPERHSAHHPDGASVLANFVRTLR